MDKITYKPLKMMQFSVLLGGKVVGRIYRMPGGYKYFPKGTNPGTRHAGGEIYQKLEDCKASIENPEQAATPKTEQEILDRIAEIKKDERLYYKSADVWTNAPLALEQLAWATRLNTLEWVLGIPQSQMPLKEINNG